MFAILQSLGATGLGILLFGSIGAGLGLLSSSAAAIGWCSCEADAKTQEPSNNLMEKSDNAKQNVQENTKENVQENIIDTKDVIDLTSQ